MVKDTRRAIGTNERVLSVRTRLNVRFRTAASRERTRRQLAVADSTVVLSKISNLTADRGRYAECNLCHFTQGGPVEAIVQDLRYGVRMLLRSPGFTTVAVLTLALGIGANTAVFSLTYAIMLRSLPVREPDRLALITFSKPGRDYGLSIPIVDDLARRQHGFDGILAWHNDSLTLKDD